jgi:hypothetical protein
VNNTQLDKGAGFREKLVARLGNAQLSDSKYLHNDSYGVEEQDNEEESLRGGNKSGVYNAVAAGNSTRGGAAQEMDEEGGSEYSNL